MKTISASLPDSPVPAAAPQAVRRPEKRRFARFHQAFDTGLLDSQKRPADGAVNLINMSCSGVAIESTRKFEVGERLGVEMDLDGGRRITATGRVQWGRPDGYFFAYGLQLEGIGFFDRNRLIKSLKPDHFGFVEAANLALEASATMVGCYAALDWLTADTARLMAAAQAIPWLLYIFMAGMAAYLARFNNS